MLQVPLLTPQIRQPLALRVAAPGIFQPVTVKCRQLTLLVLPANGGTARVVKAVLPPCLLVAPLVLVDNIGMVHRALIPQLLTRLQEQHIHHLQTLPELTLRLQAAVELTLHRRQCCYVTNLAEVGQARLAAWQKALLLKKPITVTIKKNLAHYWPKSLEHSLIYSGK